MIRHNKNERKLPKRKLPLVFFVRDRNKAEDQELQYPAVPHQEEDPEALEAPEGQVEPVEPGEGSRHSPSC